MKKLEQALKVIGEDALLPRLAEVLATAYRKSAVTSDEIKNIANVDFAEILLLAWDFKLLIPRRAARCGEWDDRILMPAPGEAYEMPNIVRYLIRVALETGEFELERALRSLYRDMGEPQWEKIPELVETMKGYAVHRIISAPRIHAACLKTGIANKTGAMIAILKGGGVISPRLGAMAPVARAGAPLYDMNPLVCL